MALHELSFAEAVKQAIELDLDAIVQGQPLHRRVREVMKLALNWAAERRAESKDFRIDAR